MFIRSRGPEGDDLSRIAGTSSIPGVNCAQGSSTLLSQYFTYDPFGNINKNVATGSSTTFLPAYSATTNRITSYSCPPTYDADGDATDDCLNNFTWDANGRPTSMGNVGQSSVNLAYDASGNMIEQTNGSATTQIVYAPDGTKLALMNGTSTLVKAFVPLTGGATAVYNSTGLAGYRHSDWLGSARLTSSPGSPTQAISEAAYGPFGEVYWSSGSGDASFTGMNQDADPNSGIYDFPAREYEMEGRWPSPDPLGIGAVDPTDPQSWNRYAYVRNSPLTLTDPNGMDYEVCVGGSYGYADSYLEADCGIYAGDTLTALNSELPSCLTAFGLDWIGGVFGTGCNGYEGAMVGAYVDIGDTGNFNVTVTADAPSMPIIMSIPGQLTDPSPVPGSSGSGIAVSGGAATAAQPSTCQLVAATGRFTPADKGVNPRFNPTTAQMLSAALANLNQQGITPVMTSGYRPPELQGALTTANSPYVVTPAKVSWHEAGQAVDFGPNANRGQFAAIEAAMMQAGFVWGGNFSTPDRNHFQSQPAGTRPAAAVVQACAAAAQGG